MASHGPLALDSRVQREALSLADAGHRVRVYCLDADERIPEAFRQRVDVRPHGRPAARRSEPVRGRAPIRQLRRFLRLVGWMRRYRSGVAAWGRWVAADGADTDVWHLHDFPALSAIAPRLASSVPYVYDSHEIYFAAGTAARLPAAVRGWLARTERRLARRSAGLVTVNDACAAELSRLGAPYTIVVHNCPPLVEVVPAGDPLRAACGISPDVPVILYHGLLARDRGLEQLVEAMDDPRLAGAHLALLGYGESREALRLLAAARPGPARIHVLDAVPIDALPAWVAPADVEALPIQPTTLNHRLSTPNKLFEAIAAGVPVVASDFPAMRAIVIGGPGGTLGELCDPTDPRSIASAIATILSLDPAARGALAGRCREAARSEWNWARQAAPLVDLYARLARDRRGGG